MAKKEIDGNTTTEEITTIIDQPKTVGNTPAITVENGTELTIGQVKTVTVNQPQIAGASSAITVENGTILTSVHDNDNDNILQECLDVFASYITVVDQYLKEGAEELEDYNGDNWGRKFVSEYAQGYLGRGGNFSFGKIMGVMGKSIWSLFYGVTAGSITMISHPLETIENAPAALGDIANVYTDGNWTQKLELTLEMAVIVYGSAKLKKMGEGGAKEAGKLAETGEAAGAIDGVVGETAEAIEGAAGKGKIRIESAGESGSVTKISLPENDAQLKHIFREGNGHIIDTPDNRSKILNVANDKKNYLGKDARGNDWYAKTESDGSQIWVRTRNGKVDNAGVNTTPRTWDDETGLYNNTSPANKCQ